MDLKKCSKCGEDKPRTAEYFHKKNSNKDGLSNGCKKCASEQKKTFYEENKNIILKNSKVYYMENKEKILTRDKKIYYESNKEKILARQKNYYKANKDMMLEYKKNYREAHKEQIAKKNKYYYKANKNKISERGKKWREENKEKYSSRHKNYREANKEKIKNSNKSWIESNREKMNNYQANYKSVRREEDPMFRATHNLRSRIQIALRGKTKSASTMELLGCSIEHFQSHIESMFRTGMTWENYGTVWHLDHIKPFAAFDNLIDPSQQREVCHYTNLQPLFAEENLRKGSKWTA